MEVSIHQDHSSSVQQYTEQYVVELICCLYQNSQNAQQASQKLTAFQTSSQAWAISVALLLYCAPETSEESIQHLREVTLGLVTLSKTHARSIVPAEVREVVAFFSAQTLCTLCQAGFEAVCQLFTRPGSSQEETFQCIRSTLAEIIWCYRLQGNSPTVRQLTQAVSACAVFTLSFVADVAMSSSMNPLIVQTGDMCDGGQQLNNSSDDDTIAEARKKQIRDAEPMAHKMVSELLESYGRSTELFPALLEVLAELPLQVNSKKIAITSQQRSIILYLVLSQTSQVWNAIAKIFDTISTFSTLTTRPKDTQQICLMNSIPVPLTSISLRQSILRCYQSWLEFHCRYNSLAEFTQCNTLPDLSNEPRLLRESSALPIMLLNLEAGIRQCISDRPIPSSVLCDYQPNEHLTVDLNGDDGSGWQVVSSASDAVIETLSFFYCNSLHIGGPDGLSPLILPLINSTNIESLFALFGSLVRINEWLRELTKSRGSQRQTSAGTTGPIPAIDVSIIPRAVLRAVANIMGKFAEVFLPAMLFSIQYDGLELSELQHEEIEIPNETQRTVMVEGIKSLCEMMIDFLFHPSLEFRHLVLDFWFSLIGNQFTQQQAQLESTRSELMAIKAQSGVLFEMLPGVNTPPMVIPTFEQLVAALMRLSTFPTTIADHPEEFPFEAWVKYRDEVGMNLTDITAIIGCAKIIEMAGTKFFEILETFKEQNVLPLASNPWQTVEVCLFVLTTVAPRAPVGNDDYIPKALESLPALLYPPKGTIQIVILHCAVARFILWTAGYIGSQRELFGKCFQLLHSFIPALMVLTGGLPEISTSSVVTQPDLHTFLTYSERVMVEALNAIVSAGATMLARNANVPESDVTFVLNGLAELAMMPKLCLESRSSLIVSAGSVLQCLPKDKMQKYHYKLGLALYNKAIEGLPDTSSISKSISTAASENLKLFFVALESVRPIDPIPLPPPSPNAVPLERSSEHRHPVLNVMEEFWSLYQRCLIEFHSNEILVEYVCHCVVRIFSQTQHHAIRYSLFHSFFEYLAQSFVQSPSVFHLGALRSMLGIFGGNIEDPIQKSLNACLVQCTECVLNAMKESGAQAFVSLSPDIVGMTLDCTNTALTSAIETAGLLAMEQFQHCLNLSITLTPECHHPKVLMTMMLLMMRFVSWLKPRQSDEQPQAAILKGRSSEKWNAAAKRSSELAQRLTSELDLINKIVKSVVRATTEIFHGNTQWLGIIGSLLVDLLGNQEWCNQTRIALRISLEAIPRNILPALLVEEVVETFNKDESVLNHRMVCSILQRLADQSEVNCQKSQFRTSSVF